MCVFGNTPHDSSRAPPDIGPALPESSGDFRRPRCGRTPPSGVDTCDGRQHTRTTEVTPGRSGDDAPRRLPDGGRDRSARGHRRLDARGRQSGGRGARTRHRPKWVRWRSYRASEGVCSALSSGASGRGGTRRVHGVPSAGFVPPSDLKVRAAARGPHAHRVNRPPRRRPSRPRASTRRWPTLPCRCPVGPTRR